MATSTELLANAKIAAAKITPAKFPAAKGKAKTPTKTAAKAKTAAKSKTKAKTPTWTTCAVCVNGTGRYRDIAKHNRKNHGGKFAEAK